MWIPTFRLPENYPRIRQVGSFRELATSPFEDGINALCWPRKLGEGFDEIVRLLDPSEGINVLHDSQLTKLKLSEVGRQALAILLEDRRMLRELHRDPQLNCINGYPRDETSGPVATDVFSFHADSAPVETDTWLCTYHGPASEGLRNDKAIRRVDLPQTRADLLKSFGGEDDEAFAEFLSDHCYDLHYVPTSEVSIYSFGVGNLWRIAVDWPGSPVPPCIHRAPATLPGDPPRLLLIS